MDRSQLCDSLITWMETFGVGETLATGRTASDFSDGVYMSKVLHQIAPEFFSSYWLSKIKSDDVTNWRLKVSNLKRVLNGIIDYNSEILGYQIPDFNMPDVNLIGESNDRVELSRMLQLILSCAVNCQEKQEYIQRIRHLEESVQHMVMTAIQELMLKETSMSSSTDPESEITDELRKTIEKLNNALQQNDELAQRCHELDLQVTSLQDENQYITAQNSKLAVTLERRDIDDPTTPAGRRLQQQQSQITTLQEELFRLEAAKEDYKMKNEVLTKDNSVLQQKVTDLSPLAEQANHLRDEIDILRHTSEQVLKYETTIETYKRRFDELNELKEQNKISEEKILNLLEEKNNLHEDLKKTATIKEQLYNSKKDFLELKQKLSEQTKKADKVTNDAGSRETIIDTLRKEKERLMLERDSLKELNEELQCAQLSTAGLAGDCLPSTSPPSMDMLSLPLPLRYVTYSNEELQCAQLSTAGLVGDCLPSTSPPSMDMLSLPLPLRQKMIQLEHEVKMLRPVKEKLDEVEVDRDMLSVKVEEVEGKHSRLQHDIELANERLKCTEAYRDDLQARLTEREEAVNKTEQRLRQTQEDTVLMEEKYKKYFMKAKSREGVVLMEEKYKKYFMKAKSLIEMLDPKLNRNITPDLGDVNGLRGQVAEKDKFIDSLQKELDKTKHHKEQERKLMVSAWYNMSMQLHRKAVDERLSSAMPGQSFLARQRQAHSRRSTTSSPLSASQLLNTSNK